MQLSEQNSVYEISTDHVTRMALNVTLTSYLIQNQQSCNSVDSWWYWPNKKWLLITSGVIGINFHSLRDKSKNTAAISISHQPIVLYQQFLEPIHVGSCTLENYTLYCKLLQRVPAPFIFNWEHSRVGSGIQMVKKIISLVGNPCSSSTLVYILILNSMSVNMVMSLLTFLHPLEYEMKKKLVYKNTVTCVAFSQMQQDDPWILTALVVIRDYY